MSKFYNGYVINPESYWRPSYRISPFNTSYVKKNRDLLIKGEIDSELLRTFFGNNFIYCKSGKHAIAIALEQYHLERDDEVWILTTSGNKYISSCVTNEIEKYCKWSREKSEQSKLIFVNHEFGFCYTDLEQLNSYGLPIIEDMALSFASTDEHKRTGTIGDFVIYSLPKFFPINYGGILKSNNPQLLQSIEKADDYDDLCLSILLSYYLKEVEEIKRKRIHNYRVASSEFSKLGFQCRFEMGENEIPGVFMFQSKELNLPQLKVFMQSNGIESSVFYGEDSFFIPVHQEITESDIYFFYQLVNYFIENGNQ